MKKLFNDICEGLKKQGYKENGSSDVFRIFSKDGDAIKVYMYGIRSITVGYYYKDDELND